MSKVVTRYAPSPTGFTHIGGVRTALYAWLFARKHGGTFILRIEDTDKEREVQGAIPHVIECLTWLGIEWDEGVDIGGPHAPYLQSERLETYRTYAHKLIDAGFAYPDPYTEVELEALRKEAEEAKRPFLFRDHRKDTTVPWDGSKPLRFRVPEVKRFTWQDAVRGELSAGEEALDDFVLIKSDGYPTYNFAHVVDDIEMEVTHVMRGEEFISSTPKFLSLYEALGATPPLYATMPVILGPDGKKKLSKRDGAKDVLEYRAEGYMPEALMNFLALLGWNPGTPEEVFSAAALISEFDLSRVHSAGARFDEIKLKSLNQIWMRTLPPEEYVSRGRLIAKDNKRLLKVVPLLKERAQTFAEAHALIEGELRSVFETPHLDKEMLTQKETGQGTTAEFLAHVQDMVASLPDEPLMEDAKNALMPYADEKGRAAVLWPLRYALSGEQKSPDPFTLISILGRTESISRIRTALAILGE